MQENYCFKLGRQSVARVLCLILFALGLALAVSAGNRVRLSPHYVSGQTFRYRIDSRVATSGKITTPILNPEGATAFTVNIHLLVLLDVLKALADADHSAAPRLRATYEKASAESQSDAFDPAYPSPAAQYAKLEGRSLEFTVDPNGAPDNVQGIADIFPGHNAAQSVLSWFSEVSSSATFPIRGIEIGQEWKSERPIEGTPFSDLISRSESTYLRDEACNADSPIGPAGAPRHTESAATQTCAVILTRLTIFRRGSSHSEATSEDYLRNGLRVSGSWTGSGESLDSISLSTGFLVRSTQTSGLQTDYDVVSAATGSKVHNKSHVQAQSEIALVAPVAPSSASE